MKNTTNISYVIPAYNSEKTIKESVLSIFYGNYKKGDQIIIVNDKSTDNTAKIVKNLCSRIPLITINNRINIGCPASRNVGIQHATNELIYNLDADNVLAPDSTHLLAGYLVANNADIASFSDIVFFKNKLSHITHKWAFPYKTLEIEDLFTSVYNPAPSGNYMYTKKMAKSLGYYETLYGKGLHESWIFSLKALAAHKKFIVLPESHYFHRFGHKSLYQSEIENTDTQHNILKKVTMKHKKLFTTQDYRYLMISPNWIDELDQKPIILKEKKLGKKGTMKIINKLTIEYMILFLEYLTLKYNFHKNI